MVQVYPNSYESRATSAMPKASTSATSATTIGKHAPDPELSSSLSINETLNKLLAQKMGKPTKPEPVPEALSERTLQAMLEKIVSEKMGPTKPDPVPEALNERTLQAMLEKIVSEKMGHMKLVAPSEPSNRLSVEALLARRDIEDSRVFRLAMLSGVANIK